MQHDNANPTTANIVTDTNTKPLSRLKYLITICALLICTNIIIGTLGAHLWQAQLIEHNGVTNFATARDYLFIHALAVLFIALLDYQFPLPKFNYVAYLQLTAVLVFSGSLILYSLTGIKAISAITPFGGSTLMLSWLLLAWRATKLK